MIRWKIINHDIIAAREMAGIPKRNENLAASRLSQPVTRAVEIVIPDLETPGKTAKAWERPIKKLLLLTNWNEGSRQKNKKKIIWWFHQAKQLE